MKNSKLILHLLVVSLFFVTSCELFTQSIGTSLSQDEASMLAKSAASDIINAENADPSAILEALATKDEEEILDLKTSDKDSILEITLGESIDATNAQELIDSLMDQDTEVEIDTIIDTIFDIVVDTTNTSAAVTLLSDPDTLQTADATTIAEASVAILAQSAKALDTAEIDFLYNLKNAENIDMENSTTDDIVTAIMGDESDLTEDESAEIAANLTVALDALKVVSGTDTTVTSSDGTQTIVSRDVSDEEVSIMGFLTLEDLFNLF